MNRARLNEPERRIAGALTHQPYGLVPPLPQSGRGFQAQ